MGPGPFGPSCGVVERAQCVLGHGAPRFIGLIGGAMRSFLDEAGFASLKPSIALLLGLGKFYDSVSL
eukprot:4726916-Pyramimonas_sp.AAC.1